MNGQFLKDMETFVKVFNQMKEMEKQNDDIVNVNVHKDVEVISELRTISLK